jgi:type II secretory pathway predicted ATPase ExeA
MIRSHFGLARHPFAVEDDTPLLEHQQRHFDILSVHNRQGGFCVILGEPGTGKTILKNAIIRHDPRQWITPVINRTMHTWHNLMRLLCAALNLDTPSSTTAACPTTPSPTTPSTSSCAPRKASCAP